MKEEFFIPFCFFHRFVVTSGRQQIPGKRFERRPDGRAALLSSVVAGDVIDRRDVTGRRDLIQRGRTQPGVVRRTALTSFVVIYIVTSLHWSQQQQRIILKTVPNDDSDC